MCKDYFSLVEAHKKCKSKEAIPDPLLKGRTSCHIKKKNIHIMSNHGKRLISLLGDRKMIGVE